MNTQNISSEEIDLDAINRELLCDRDLFRKWDKGSHVNKINRELAEYHAWLARLDEQKIVTNNAVDYIVDEKSDTYVFEEFLTQKDRDFFESHWQFLEKSLWEISIKRIRTRLNKDRKQNNEWRVDLRLEEVQDYIKYFGEMHLKIKAETTAYRSHKISKILKKESSISDEDIAYLSEDDMNIIYKTTAFQELKDELKNKPQDASKIRAKTEVFCNSITHYIVYRKNCPELSRNQIRNNYNSIYNSVKKQRTIKRTRNILEATFDVPWDIMKKISDKDLIAISSSNMFVESRKQIVAWSVKSKHIASDTLEFYIEKWYSGDTNERKKSIEEIYIGLKIEYEVKKKSLNSWKTLIPRDEREKVLGKGFEEMDKDTEKKVQHWTSLWTKLKNRVFDAWGSIITSLLHILKGKSKFRKRSV